MFTCHVEGCRSLVSYTVVKSNILHHCIWSRDKNELSQQQSCRFRFHLAWRIVAESLQLSCCHLVLQFGNRSFSKTCVAHEKAR
jgi:hypothetical protein